MEIVEKQSMPLDDLPDEIRQVIQLEREKKKERIEALSSIVAKRRDEAVAARKASGIERIWKEDEEYYLGIDDANRAHHAFTKSMSPDGGLQSSTSSDTAGECTAFFNITRQFVDSAAARLGDILLPSGDWNFSISPTPIPELSKIEDSDQPVVDGAGQPVANPNGTQEPYTMGQFAKDEMSEAAEKTEKAEKRIRDWLTECSYHSEVRKVIEDSAKLGAGIIRGAYPAVQKVRVVKDGKLEIIEKIVPSSKYVSLWDFYPDPNCGESIQNGSYCLEVDRMTPRQLRELKGDPSFISDNIDKVLKEGVNKVNVQEDGFRREGKTSKDERFQVWYYFGSVDLDDLKACNAIGEDDHYDADAVPAVVVMVNDTVIKGYVNPLDNGEFPYDVMCWQRLTDMPYGMGIARQGRVAQDMLNASARVMMVNAGLSSAPQIILRQSAIRPADGEWKLVRGKIWLASEEADLRNVADAITSIMIPSMQQELANIIQMAYKMMEDATGVSFLLQGQQGSAPDTVGGMQLLHQNSSSLLRRIARVFDESVTEPHIRRYYDWLLVHGEDDEKGDLQISAVGSTALVEREIQAQQAAQLLQMSLDPRFEMSPAKTKAELLRAWRFEPTKFDLTADEKKAMQEAQQAAQQGQVAPQVQAAQIRAQSDQQIAQIRSQAEVQKMSLDSDRDTAYNESIRRRDQMTYESRIEELRMRKELAMLDYSAKHNIKLEDIKSQLAQTAMKLRVQKELATKEGGGAQVIEPLVEPAGRAPNGRAFTE